MTSSDSTIDFVGPTPDWWAELWPLRQIELRQRIRHCVRDAPKGFTRGAVEILLRAYDPREVHAALVGLVADGVIVLEGERYRVPKEDGVGR